MKKLTRSSTAKDVFVDTSGFFALLVKGDDGHARAGEIVQRAKGPTHRFVTTDYVLDETATLLRARGYDHLLKPFLDLVLESRACRVEWTDSDRFRQTWSFMLSRLDHAWSFTDCLSFYVMKHLRITKALTKDTHFFEAGFDALIAHK